MSYVEKCKGCSASVRILSQDIRNMVEEIINSGEFKLVTEEAYGKRLEQCSNCEYLEYGTTCMQCGCIVQVRALLTDKDCPHIRKSKW